ncbi:MAG: alpha/beta hydrolase [Chitinophagaceae bacterium]
MFATAACQKNNDPADPNAAVNQSNISYGTEASQKMDLYLPKDRTTTTTKVIILIHGGAWTEGDKSDFTAYFVPLQQRLPGYAIFNINYRLASGSSNLFPTQENDVKKAIEFIYSKRNEYHISDKFVFLGASAGAHLALLQGFKYNTPVKPKAVVSFFAPTNLTALYNDNAFAATVMQTVTGTTPALNATLYQQSSPSGFVTAASPPTILLQGGADPIVPFSQADSFNALLGTAGVPHQYVFYPGEGHGWTGNNLNDSFDKIAAFLTQYVN